MKISLYADILISFLCSVSRRKSCPGKHITASTDVVGNGWKTDINWDSKYKSDSDAMGLVYGLNTKNRKCGWKTTISKHTRLDLFVKNINNV